MEPSKITKCEVVDMPMELSVFDPLDAQIAEAKAKNENLAFDYHDKKVVVIGAGATAVTLIP